MRILYIINPGAERGISGSHRAILNLIIEVIKDRNNTVAAVIPREGFFSELLENKGIKCYYPFRYTLTSNPSLKFDKKVIERYLRYLMMLYRRLRARQDLNKIIDEFKPQIVHTNVGPLDIANTICKKKNIPHVWHLREYQDLIGFHFFPSKKKYYQNIQSENNHIIAITQGIFNHFKLGNKDKVIYDGVFDKKSTLSVDISKKEYFLFVGRISESKGVFFLLESYLNYIMKGGDTELLLAGSEMDRVFYNKCQSFVKNNQLNDKVSFLGVRSDIDSLMQHAKALIVPSMYEGFGFITAEAMYNKCLVIGRNTTGTKEQFDNGFNLFNREIGYRFNTKDDLALCLFNADSFGNSQMLEDAFNTVNKLYSNQECTKQVLAFYNEILSKQ